MTIGGYTYTQDQIKSTIQQEAINFAQNTEAYKKIVECENAAETIKEKAKEIRNKKPQLSQQQAEAQAAEEVKKSNPISISPDFSMSQASISICKNGIEATGVVNYSLSLNGIKPKIEWDGCAVNAKWFGVNAGASYDYSNRNYSYSLGYSGYGVNASGSYNTNGRTLNYSASYSNGSFSAGLNVDNHGNLQGNFNYSFRPPRGNVQTVTIGGVTDLKSKAISASISVFM